MKALGIAFAILLVVIAIPACSVRGMYNALQTRNLDVEEKYAKLNSVYQKRADLVPKFVETVKAATKQESSVLLGVAEARAGVARATPPAEGATPEQVERYDQAQRELRTALASAMRVTVESNPQVASMANFQRLQQDLKDIEGQATAARNVYIRSVRGYNANVVAFPNNLVAGFFGMTKKPQLAFDDEPSLKKSPKLGF